MTMSGGLGADASDAVYSEDVVTYADPSLVVTGARVPVEFDGSQATAGWSRAWEGVTTVGLVSKVAGASDDEEDSEWEEEEEEPLEDGHAKVCWLRASASVHDDHATNVKNADLRVLDRAFLHGDIVARSSDALGQTGNVTAVTLDVDLLFADGTAVRGVSTKRLTHVRNYRPGHYVVHDNWVGRIEEVCDDVAVRFRDGSECLIKDADPTRLEPQANSSLFPDEEQCPYFPGCRVQCSAPSVLRHAKYVRGSARRANAMIGFSGAATGWVTAVFTGDVTVDWLAGAGHGGDAPPTVLPASVLWPLTYYGHTCWQLGDRVVVDDEAPEDPYGEDAESSLPLDGLYDNGEDPAALLAAYREADAKAGAAARAAETAEAAGELSGLNQKWSAMTEEKLAALNALNTNTSGGPRSLNTFLNSFRRGGRKTRSTRSREDAERVASRGVRRASEGPAEEAEEEAEAGPQTTSGISPLRQSAMIIATHTRVDVHWQDGRLTRRVNARDLVPITHLGEHDFWPEQFVVKTADEELYGDGGGGGPDANDTNNIAAALGGGGGGSSEANRAERIGVVQTVNPVERIARVRWLAPGETGRSPATETDPGAPSRLEDVSVYELQEHADYSFRLGDIVLRLDDANASILRRTDDQEEEDDAEDAPTAGNVSSSGSEYGSESEYESFDEEDEAAESSDEDENDPSVSRADSAATAGDVGVGGPAPRGSRGAAARAMPDATTLTWVGEIVGVSGGRIRVAWGDGTVAAVPPHGLYIASGEDRGEDDIGSLLDEGDFDDGASDASWETLSDGEGGGGAGRSGGDAEGRRGVPEVTRAAGGHFPAHMDPVAQAWAMQQREEAEHSWLTEHQRRAGGPAAAPVHSSTLAAARGSSVSEASSSNPSQMAAAAAPVAAETPEASGLSKDQAARAAAALGDLLRMAANHNHLEGGPGQGLDRSASRTEAEAIGTNETNGQSVAALTDLFRAMQQNVPQASAQTPGVESDVPSLAPPLTPSSPSPADEEAAVGEAAGSTEANGSSSSSFGGYARFDTVAHDAEDAVVASVAASTAGSSSAVPPGAGIGPLSDHYYLSEPTTHLNDRKWARRVTKEWGILQSSLPETIWCRVYEDRMDLVRAVMLGPEGTPYHDNLFVFDFHFGPGYPNEPPAAHYHSYGLRVNPNLYESGKVCLSLLHTWQGKGSEVWNPESSNMLQVLVSIQGLVLVDKPYYNEAGYEKQLGSDEGERNTAQYNEQAFLASAKTMLHLLRRPPKHTAPLVRDHFKRRGGAVLAACEAYLDGCPVGAYVVPGENRAPGAKPSENTCAPSGGFKLMLSKLVPKLRAAFAENDAR